MVTIKNFMFNAFVIIVIIPYGLIRIFLIGTKWYMRGTRFGWTREKIETEADHEYKKFESRLFKKLKSL